MARVAIGQKPTVLRFVPHANLTLLEPIFTTALVTINHGWAIYDTLFFATSKFELRPQMADGYTLSDEGRTYSIKPRDNLEFHNGEPVRAQDAAPSLPRQAAREAIGQTLWKFVDVCEAQAMTPVEQFFARGLGQTGWFGWYNDPEFEQLVQELLLAPDPAAAQAAADKVQARAFDQVPDVPSGQFQIRTARRKNVQGQIEARGAFFWNIRRV